MVRVVEVDGEEERLRRVALAFEEIDGPLRYPVAVVGLGRHRVEAERSGSDRFRPRLAGIVERGGMEIREALAQPAVVGVLG